MKDATIEELEQRILTIYDAHNGDISNDRICAIVQEGCGCGGVQCVDCPLDVAYLAAVLRAKHPPMKRNSPYQPRYIG